MEAVFISPVPVITIDGPSGSGKGTIAQWLSQQLDWHLLDSGALYRLLALAAIEQAIPVDNETMLAALARKLDIEFDTQSAGGVVTRLAGVDVSKALRSENCAAAASQVAALPEVRAALLDRQRDFRRLPGLVADGRDMGTVVFVDAVLKIYLTASVQERAERRYKQLNEKGIDANLLALFKDIKARDERDSNRTISPLKSAEDAVTLDTTDTPIEAVCATVLRLAQEKGMGVVSTGA